MELRKTLGLWDIVLFNVTAITGLRWVSLAAAGGNVSMMLWLSAMLFFFLPQAFAVIELTRRLPGEGGVYLWTKTTLGDFHGFMAGWCYWTNNLVYLPNLLVYVAGISVFVLGGQYQEVGESKTYVVIFSLVVLWGVILANLVGLQVGRWLNNVGGIGTWTAGGALVTLGAIAVFKYGVANPMPAESFFTGFASMDRLSFWASMCFAFSGFELASVMAGEVRSADRSIPRAVIISGLVVALIYVLGTFALLVSLPANDISIITGFLQGIAAVSERLGLGWTTAIIALLITLGGVGGVMAWFTGAARMPFVAGVDHYLPAGFGRIHPKYGSPYVAILIQGAIATLFIIMSFVGATVEEAYLILLDTTLLVYFLPYLYMFVAYLVLRRRARTDGTATSASGPELPRNRVLAWILGVCGLLTTLFAMTISAVPPEEATGGTSYELKVIGGFLMFLASGAFIYWWKKHKS